ncbi:hypothetical protein WJX74_010894 [Apatococcus lobatus]|uniref:Uncharacterized protein n=1 Tax=Apatococcus lobatus TaxID=904363 RepID=A0AAW1QYR2_9CHLO
MAATTVTKVNANVGAMASAFLVAMLLLHVDAQNPGPPVSGQVAYSGSCRRSGSATIPTSTPKGFDSCSDGGFQGACCTSLSYEAVNGEYPHCAYKDAGDNSPCAPGLYAYGACCS